jgi:hypothetical protein
MNWRLKEPYKESMKQEVYSLKKKKKNKIKKLLAKLTKRTKKKTQINKNHT